MSTRSGRPTGISERPRRTAIDELKRNRGVIWTTLALGFIGCILYSTIFPKWPISEWLIFVSAVGGSAYGIRTIRSSKENVSVTENNGGTKVDPFMG